MMYVRNTHISACRLAGCEFRTIGEDRDIIPSLCPEGRIAERGLVHSKEGKDRNRVREYEWACIPCA